jgi:hypothetical protein
MADVGRGDGDSDLARGWWTVPILGAAYGVASGGKTPGRWAAFAGAAAWGALLVLPLARGYPVGALATRLAGAMQLPTAVLVGVTLVLPALLGGTAAVLAQGLRGRKT